MVAIAIDFNFLKSITAKLSVLAELKKKYNWREIVRDAVEKAGIG
jgi:hypothetical protein